LNISNSIDRHHAETLGAPGRKSHLESSHFCELGDWDLLPAMIVVNFGNTLPHDLGRTQSVMFLTGTKSDACDFGHISDRK
jgi:hypothetical protein